MVVGFITTCKISEYHHTSCKFELCSGRGVVNTTLCEVYLWRIKGRFSPGTPVSTTNKTDRHDYNWNIVESDVKHHKPIILESVQKIF